LTKKQIILTAQAATLLSVVPVILYANLTGPDAGYSGAPGEQNCAFCHNSNNSGGGKVTVQFQNGLFYTPGTSQTMIVAVSDLSEQSWGFELTARQGTNNSSSTGTQAGTFTPGGEGYTQVVCADAIPVKNESFAGTGPCPNNRPWQWIEQTWNPNNPTGNPQIGARVGTSRGVTFTFTWNPPSSVSGPIDIYVAAVAGDGSDAYADGHVYTAHYTLTQPLPNQPAIASAGVVNGASFQPSIGPGSWVTIKGTNLANSTRPWGAADLAGGNLPTSLDGVSVTIGGFPAFVEYVSPTQVNVLAPSGIPLGNGVAVQLVNNGLQSFPGSATVNSVAPAMFLWNNKYAVATSSDFKTLIAPNGLFPNATTAPAAGGETIILWTSGLGTTKPAVASGSLTPSFGPTANVLHAPVVMIGGQQATVIGAALAPGFAGLYQVAVTVPSGLTDGDQPITIQSQSITSPSGVFLNIKN
jgi:uncharacterized protein (TIGR03437 family)